MKKYRQRLSTLLLVVGYLCLVIGGIFGLLALLQYEHERAPFYRMAMIFAAAGICFMAIRFFTIVLPEIISDRRSDSQTRRRAFFKNNHRPIHRHGRHRHHNEDGGILIMTLVLLGLISILSFQAIVASRTSAAEARHTLQANTLKMTAMDAARSALQQLADDPDLSVDHLTESWATRQEYTDPAGITRMIRIQDAQRAFDLNNLAVTTTGNMTPPADILANIMILSGIFTPSQRIDTLRDWLDADQAGPFESPYYQQKSVLYDVANRLLYGWGDLFLVDGWSPEMLKRKISGTRRNLFSENLADGVDILAIPRQRIIPININTAHVTALRGVLGVEQDALIDTILARRKEAPYPSTNFLIDQIGENTFQRITPYLDVRSTYYRIQTTAYFEGQSANLTLLASRTDDGALHVLEAAF